MQTQRSSETPSEASTRQEKISTLAAELLAANLKIASMEKAEKLCQNAILELQDQAQSEKDRLQDDLTATKKKLSQAVDAARKCQVNSEQELKAKSDELRSLEARLAQAQLSGEQALTDRQANSNTIQGEMKRVEQSLQDSLDEIKALKQMQDQTQVAKESAQADIIKMARQLEDSLAGRDKEIAEMKMEIEVHKLQSSMNVFYAILNPQKLVDVPKLALTFLGDSENLNSEMRKVYDGLDLSSNVDALLKRMDAIQSQTLKDKTIKIDSVHNSLKQVELELEFAQNLAKDAEREIKTRETKISGLEQELKSTKDSLTNSKKKLRHVEESCEKALEESGAILQQTNESLEKANLARKELEDGLQSMSKELTECNAVQATLEEQVKTLESTVVTQQEALEHKTTELKVVADDLRSAEHMLKKSQDEGNAFKESQHQLQSEKDRLQGDFTSSKEKLSQAVDDARKRQVNSEQELKAKSDELQSLEARLAQAQLSGEQAQKGKESLEKETIDLREALLVKVNLLQSLLDIF